jgi:predicted alpha/beta-fold hydrolase
VIDPSNSDFIAESIDVIKRTVGQDCEVYGVGFSLGANHLLRYLGTHEKDNTRIKAAISVSNPFDVIATTIGLKDKCFGIYDRSIKEML